MPDELVLVDGATGFIGSHVVEFLIQKGFRVRATDLPQANFSLVKELGAEAMPANLLNKEEIKPLLDGVSRVFHIAGMFDLGAPYEKLYAANVTVTKNMCEAALDADLKSFVHWSTVGVYGRIFESPVREDHPKNPLNAYEETKWLGEQTAVKFHEENGLPVAVIRPTLVYGPRNRYGVALFSASMALLRAKLRRESSLILWIMRGLKGGPMGHYVHAKDVAQAAWLLSEKKEAIGNAYNVADDTPLSLSDSLQAIAEPFGINLKRRGQIPVSKKLTSFIAERGRSTFKPMLGRLDRVLAEDWEKLVKQYNLVPALRPRIDLDWITYAIGDHVYDNSKIKALGLKLFYPDFRQGIRETTEWYWENRWLPRFD